MKQSTLIHGNLIRSAAVVFAGLFINQTLQTAGGVVLARVLPSQTLFGQVSVLQQLLGMSGLFLNVGLNSAVTFFVARHGAKAIRASFGQAVQGSLAAGIAVAGALTLLASPIAAAYRMPGLAAGLAVGSLILVMNSYINISIALYSGLRRFTAQAALMVATTLLSVSGSILGALYALRHGDTLFAVSFGMAATDVLTCAVAFAFARRLRATVLVRIRPRSLKKMLRYGVPNWAGNIAKAFQQPYLVIITGATSAVSAGYLSNALKIAGFLNIITWAFNVVALPLLSQAMHAEAEARRRGTLCFRYNNFILFPLTLLICLFPREILLALFGARYVTPEALVYVRLTGVGVLFSSVSRLGGTMLAGIGRTRANFWTMIASGAVLFAAAPFVVGKHPEWGTWVYAGGWAVSAAALFWFLVRDGLPLDWRQAFAEPLAPALFMAALLEIGAHIADIRALMAGLAITGAGALTWLIEARSRRLDPARTP